MNDKLQMGAGRIEQLTTNDDAVGRLEPVVSSAPTILDKLHYILKVEMAGCSWFGLVAIVTKEEVTGKRELNDSSDDYFDHKYVDQYSTFEDNYHGYAYVPINDGSGKYFKLEYHC